MLMTLNEKKSEVLFLPRLKSLLHPRFVCCFGRMKFGLPFPFGGAKGFNNVLQEL